MTEQKQTAAPHVLWCVHCQAQTPHWRGWVCGKVSYVCKSCWRMAGETMQPRTLESDLLEDR